MSLINKMLNDLEKRGPNADVGQPLFVDVRHSAHGNRKPRLGILLLSGITIVTAGAGFWLWSSDRKPSPPIPPEQIAALTPPPPVTKQPTQPQPVIEAAQTPAIKDAAVPEPSQRSSAVEKPVPTTPKIESVAVKVAHEQPKPVRQADKPQRATPAPVVAETPRPPAPIVAAPRLAEPVEKAPHVAGRIASFKVFTSKQQSENLYKKAIQLAQQSKISEAQDALRQSLDADASNSDARQMLAGLLIDSKQYSDAEALLRAGLKNSSGDTNLTMLLARLFVVQDNKAGALATLEQGLPQVGNEPEYHAFLAALMQSQNRHEDSVKHYLTALRSDPANSSWLLGAGISLQATQKLADAEAAFQRAIDMGDLLPESASFAEQQLKQIRSQR